MKNEFFFHDYVSVWMPDHVRHDKIFMLNSYSLISGFLNSTVNKLLIELVE